MFLAIVKCNVRLTIVGVPNMVDYKNENDLVPHNGEDVEDVEYDDDFYAPPNEGTKNNKENNANIGPT
jgi:hypothetical protein